MPHAAPAANAPSPPTPMLLVADDAMEVAGRRPAASSSHYDPARSGVDPEAMQAYLSTIQRTINCLSDPDRNTRKQAITTLLNRLTPSPSPSSGIPKAGADPSLAPPDAAMLQALVCGPLLHPVVAMLHDPGEAARSVGWGVSRGPYGFQVSELGNQWAQQVILFRMASRRHKHEQLVDMPRFEILYIDSSIDHRLAAVELMQRAAAVVPDLSAVLPALMPEVLRRMGHMPVVEPAEEVRLLLTGLVTAIVQRWVRMRPR